jgi:hypothetical protein
MRAPTITLTALTLLFTAGGLKVAAASPNPAGWIDAFLPGAICLYMTIRVWRDEPKA